MRILGIIVALAMLFSLVACQNTPSTVTMVTDDCTGQATDSVTAHATVTSPGSSLLSVRGFVYMEGTAGDPEIAVLPLGNPSFELGDPLEGWVAKGGGNLSRSSEQAKVGSYSGRMDPRGVQFPRIAQEDIGGAELATSLRGQTVTLGAWVWASKPDNNRLVIWSRTDGTWGNGGFSAYHPGDSSWHWLTASKTIETDAMGIRVDVPYFAPNSTAVAYADGAILIKGRAVFEQGSFGTSPYSLAITTLKPDTSYRIRAFAQDEAGSIYYGNVVSCETLGQE